MRGQNKEYIFETDEYKAYFLQALRKIEEEGELSVIAWCIMDNHVHLVIHVMPDIISSVFKRLNIKFAMYYHKRSKTLGHVFQDRYKSEPIETDDYLLNVTRYIHNNPIKAKMISDISDYKWSSYKNFLKGNLNTKQSWVLSIFGSRDSYVSFHQVEDNREYLEIKEDQLTYRKERAQRIVNEYCKSHGIHDYKELRDNHQNLKELIKELAKNSGLSQRQIASQYDLSLSLIQRLCKKERINKNRP